MTHESAKKNKNAFGKRVGIKTSIFQISIFLTTAFTELKKWLFEVGGTLDVVRNSTARDATE